MSLCRGAILVFLTSRVRSDATDPSNPNLELSQESYTFGIEDVKNARSHIWTLTSSAAIPSPVSTPKVTSVCVHLEPLPLSRGPFRDKRKFETSFVIVYIQLPFPVLQNLKPRPTETKFERSVTPAANVCDELRLTFDNLSLFWKF